MSITHYGQIVIGPSGSGKTTYCSIIQDHSEVLNRNVYVVNLDPATNQYAYDCYVDIRELICVEEVMSEYKLGPNGALVFCLEFLLENLDWLKEALDDIPEDGYLLFDCPGQIELYSHLDPMPKLIKFLTQQGYSLCSVCLLDSTFIQDESWLISGLLVSLSFQYQLNIQTITVITKCDLLDKDMRVQKIVKKILQKQQVGYQNEQGNAKQNQFQKLTSQLAEVLSFYGGLELLPLNVNDEESIQEIIYQCDQSIQYGEYLESKESAYEQAENYLNHNSQLIFSQFKKKLLNIMKYFLFNLIVIQISFQNIIQQYYPINGGEQMMYYYTTFLLGSERQKQTGIIDTGSDLVSFPCEFQQSRFQLENYHINKPFRVLSSNTIQYDSDCIKNELDQTFQACWFVKRYAEGSSLNGIKVQDKVSLGVYQKLSKRLWRLNNHGSKVKSTRALFGCSQQEEGLFKTQKADGIVGLSQDSTFIRSIQNNHNQQQKTKRNLSFGLCFHNQGGFMSFDFRDKVQNFRKLSIFQEYEQNNKQIISVKFYKNNHYFFIPFKSISFNKKRIKTSQNKILIDSGSTFTHFPSDIFQSIWLISSQNKLLNKLFNSPQHCLSQKQFKQKELQSLNNIEINFAKNQPNFKLKPKQYLYYKDYNRGDQRQLCLAIKQGQRNIILGAFGIRDYYFYFNKNERQIQIVEENCQEKEKILLAQLQQ